MGKWNDALGRLWPASIWQRSSGSQWTAKRCGAGRRRKDYGDASAASMPPTAEPITSGSSATDGSFHEWLEERGGRRCLINLVDDATGTDVAWFAEEETTWAVAGG